MHITKRVQIRTTPPAAATVVAGRLNKGGAPLGSQNYRNGRLVKEAFVRALRKRSRADMLTALDDIADKIIRMALKGSIPAARELFDRVEGKAVQTVIGDPENPIIHKHVTEMTDEELEAIARGNTYDGQATRV